MFSVLRYCQFLCTWPSFPRLYIRSPQTRMFSIIGAGVLAAGRSALHFFLIHRTLHAASLAPVSRSFYSIAPLLMTFYRNCFGKNKKVWDCDWERTRRSGAWCVVGESSPTCYLLLPVGRCATVAVIVRITRVVVHYAFWPALGCARQMASSLFAHSAAPTPSYFLAHYAAWRSPSPVPWLPYFPTEPFSRFGLYGVGLVFVVCVNVWWISFN